MRRLGNGYLTGLIDVRPKMERWEETWEEKVLR